MDYRSTVASIGIGVRETKLLSCVLAVTRRIVVNNIKFTDVFQIKVELHSALPDGDHFRGLPNVCASITYDARVVYLLRQIRTYPNQDLQLVCRNGQWRRDPQLIYEEAKFEGSSEQLLVWIHGHR